MNPDVVTPAGVGRAEFLGLFSAVMLPMFLASVDQTLLATATTAIGHELGALADTAWVAIGYLMAAAVMIPLYGRLGDRHGYRRLLLAALAVFALGCALGGLAPTMGWLVAARVCQGLGGGGLMVLSQALIGQLVPPRERPRYQGWFAAVFTLSSVSGPVLGGLVMHALGWRWLFWGLLPVVAVAMWRVSRLPHAVPGRAAPVLADGWGLLGFGVASVLTLLWVSFAGQRFDWASPTSVALAGAAVGLWGVLAWHEQRHPAAFLPIEVLRLPGVASIAVTIMIFAAAMFALVFFVPIYLQLGQGHSASLAGLQLLPLTLGMAIGAVGSSRIVSRTGQVGVLPPYGLGLAGGALWVLALAPASGPAQAWVLNGALFVCGLGFGTVMPNAQIIVQTRTGRSGLGAGSALISLARSAGANLGTAVFGATLFNQLRAASSGFPSIELWLAQQPQGSAALVAAFRWSFAALALLLFLGAWVARRMPVMPLDNAPAEAGGEAASSVA